MKTRFITAIAIAIFYIVILFLTVFVHKTFYDFMIVVFMVSATFELSNAIKEKYAQPNNILLLLCCCAGYIVFRVFEHLCKSSLIGIGACFFVFLLIFFFSLVINYFQDKDNLHSIIATVFICFYPISFLLMMLGINYIGDDNLSIIGIFLFFLITTFSDTFAYIVGSIFKGTKLIPKVSPKKTISGAIGGLLGGVIGAMLLCLIGLTNIIDVSILNVLNGNPLIFLIFVGFVGAALSQIGDLVASYIKRHCEIKDFGSILPGHGGVMDRIDSLIFTASYIYILFFCIYTF